MAPAGAGNGEIAHHALRADIYHEGKTGGLLGDGMSVSVQNPRPCVGTFEAGGRLGEFKVGYNVHHPVLVLPGGPVAAVGSHYEGIPVRWSGDVFGKGEASGQKAGSQNR